LTLHRTLGHADQRNHEYATLEHLLLALIDDADASVVMKACKVDLGSLKESVASYIDNELTTLVTEGDREPTPTPAFQRVVQRGVRSAEGLDREATGADLLVAMFDEHESPAVWLLGDAGHDPLRRSQLHLPQRTVRRGGDTVRRGRSGGLCQWQT
jgi:ATP-dependent Clp protease ATP-binding subunit ClpA